MFQGLGHVIFFNYLNYINLDSTVNHTAMEYNCERYYNFKKTTLNNLTGSTKFRIVINKMRHKVDISLLPVP
jgi:hypothetical protein